MSYQMYLDNFWNLYWLINHGHWKWLKKYRKDKIYRSMQGNTSNCCQKKTKILKIMSESVKLTILCMGMQTINLKIKQK